METICIKSPVGELTLFADGRSIVALSWGHGLNAPRKSKSQALNRAARLLGDYFKTGQADFSSLDLAPSGTPFRQRVWREMLRIKPGHTKSYGQVAKTLKSSPRAVGGACAANPIPILIPCHRIINADGKTGHYSGGLGPETKKFLLRLEGALN